MKVQNETKGRLGMLAAVFFILLSLSVTQGVQAGQTPIFEEHFTRNSDLDKWTLHQSSPNFINVVNNGYRGNRLALTQASTHDYVQATKSLGDDYENVLMRTYFCDFKSQTSKGTMFIVYDNDNSEQSGIGVRTDVSVKNYCIRLNYSSTGITTIDTGVERASGWHMFEIVCTNSGTFFKIDNKIVSQHYNPFHTSVSRVEYVSSWHGGGGFWDELSVIPADTENWQEQLYKPLQVQHDYFGGLRSASYPYYSFSFSSLYRNYELGICPFAMYDDPVNYTGSKQCGIHSNDLRSICDSAIVWYLLGEKTGNGTMRDQARDAFLDALAYGPWPNIVSLPPHVSPHTQTIRNVHYWSRGAVMSKFARAALLLWDDLTSGERTAVEQVLKDQAYYYLHPDPVAKYANVPKGNTAADLLLDSKAEENAWHSTFLATLANHFPQIFTANELTQVELKGRIFARHAITIASDGNYGGYDTMTVTNDHDLYNHEMLNPTYMISVLTSLGEGALTYLETGKGVPWEFKFRVSQLYSRFKTKVDWNSYHFINTQDDWEGAHNSAFVGPLVFRYMEILGYETSFPWQDYMQKRSLFYYDMSSCWINTTSSNYLVPYFRLDNTALPAYKFFVDTAHAAEFYGMTILSLQY
ncbi:MAG: hypothetical protein GY765_18145 [bacterium]|nr:hypothetical protein [bacterium]